MKPDDYKELCRIVDRLRDQDNRCTSEVAFCVQRATFEGGFDPSCANEVMFVQDSEPVLEDHWSALEKAYQAGEGRVTIGDWEYVIEELERYGFQRGWETVQVCFTEEGAKNYLRRNGHNLSRHGEPRIYVESFHRNVEMMTLRRILPELASYVVVDAVAVKP